MRHKQKKSSSTIILSGLLTSLVLAVAPVAVALVPGADIVISKDTVPAAISVVLAGDIITYRTTATNLGDDLASNLLIYDETPAGTWYHSHTTSSGGSCVVNPTGLGGAEVSCTWAGTTGVGASRWLELTVTVCSGNGCGYDIVSDRAYSVSDTLDPLPGNDQQTGWYGLGMVAAVTVPVTTQTSFGTSIVGTPATVDPGHQVTYTINIANLGPSSAETTVTTVLPTGWTVDAAGASAGSCSGLGGSFASCDLYLGGTAICAPTYTSDTITVVANVPVGAPTAPVTISAGVASLNCEPDTGDLVVHTTTWVGALFVDGFESSDTTAWAITVN